MTNQRLRTLTTNLLHTDIRCACEDIEIITGKPGIMIYMIPRAMQACEPWLRKHVTDPRFWDGKYDPSHTGETELPTPSEADRKEMFERYAAQPDPLAGKEVVKIVV